jgi:putative transposase
MRRGRPPKGSGLVDGVKGSDAAKERARVIIEVLQGDLTVSEACARLGVGETRFHQLRELFLSEGVRGLEPGFSGRPAKVESEEGAKVRELEERVAQLEKELKAAEIRARIAQVMPHLIKDGEDPRPKGKSKGRRVKKK